MPDRHYPEKHHLVASQSPTHVYVWRRQEDWHYEIPKTLLLPEAFQDVVKEMRQHAQRRGIIVQDDLREVVACMALLLEIYRETQAEAARKGTSPRLLLQAKAAEASTTGR